MEAPNFRISFIKRVYLLSSFQFLLQVQGSLRLPLAGIASPRLLMCSASMGAEGSVTLQLREAVEAPDSNSQIDTTALTIGYSESDIIADMLGSIQAAGKEQKINTKKICKNE